MKKNAWFYTSTEKHVEQEVSSTAWHDNFLTKGDKSMPNAWAHECLLR